MTNLINFINTIPESFGWFFVGAVASLCAIMGFKNIKIFLEMLGSWGEEEEEEI